MVQSMKDDGINAAVMDAEDLTFVDQFDAVFSNAALHWCKDHDKVIAGVKKALVPGGRFVCEQGGFGNIKVIREALHAALQGRGITDLEARDPWNFSDVESMSRLLVKYGFTINSIELIPRPTRLPTDVKDWVDLFGNTFLVGFDAETRAAVLEEVQAACASLWDEDHGCYFADYVRLRYEAKLEH
ncbi:hypothetical protein SARC_12339 [Sphaeroforma arctica JP610]|uniref:Methyltransferase type 11 domain-containing protein n=1 Tax=Sphaeroforma arctica JP610 TaxID=667725 RepID=A0A0L0FEE4_9EUKA|nr:hypothetical protein SARC_12339 [Sphaeroforma arctica JP610]KNC75127.1 hypothetical protein SARC_12339 [Sphaeroforma arctica JP610]|eukprot:XP_014149029.1 hypothetical protein SARC_12339 [Sphaeroforma arctica JP610]